MNNDLLKIFKKYIEDIDLEKMRNVWSEQSKRFIDFWDNKIMDDSYLSLSDSEIDEIVLILDKKAKGSTKNHYAVANVMIPQGVWRRLFKEINEIKKLNSLLNKIFVSDNDEEKIIAIDKLYEFNKGRKNSLTGKSGNAINSMLFTYSPTKYLAVVSLNDRRKIIDYYQLSNKIDFEDNSQGKKIIQTNKIIIDGFKAKGIDTTPQLLSQFLYDELKEDWRSSDEDSETAYEDNTITTPENDTFFHLENELENFLIANWDNTKLAKDYELIEENGELVSQQYKTDIGKIDILVEDKKTKQLVVIELKRNQTSDDTVGQILRYIGWLKTHKTNNQDVKGIIIARRFDEKLHYALKTIDGIQTLIYKVNFTLSESKIS